MPVRLSANDLRELLAGTGSAPVPAGYREEDDRLFWWLALAIGAASCWA